MLGIGGGAIMVPLLVWFFEAQGLPKAHILHLAIGTAAVIGFPIALSGTIGFVATGLRESGLPPYSVGFVYLPGMVGIVAASMLVAPLGAAAAHRLPTVWLKRIFALLFYVMATRMLITFL